MQVSLFVDPTIFLFSHTHWHDTCIDFLCHNLKSLIMFVPVDVWALQSPDVTYCCLNHSWPSKLSGWWPIHLRRHRPTLSKEKWLAWACVHRYNGSGWKGCLEIRGYVASRCSRRAEVVALCFVSMALMKWWLKLTKEHTCLPMTPWCESQVRQECALKKAVKNKEP